jgi:hypothetical protein
MRRIHSFRLQNYTTIFLAALKALDSFQITTKLVSGYLQSLTTLREYNRIQKDMGARI